MKALVTAYCACALCCGSAGRLNAASSIPRVGLSIAAPRAVPFGTWVMIDIPGVGRIRRRVDDRTASRYDGRWDVFVATHREAIHFGIHRATISIQPTQ